MIVKILEKPAAALSNILEYNEKDKKEGIPDGELLSTNLMGETWEERFDEFNQHLDRGKANPILHIPIRLAPGENLSNEQFTELSLSYMEKMGLSPEEYPYQLIRHHDKKDGEHVHLVISRSSINGEYWNPHQYQKLSSKARQELEDTYQLQRLKGDKFSQDKTLNEVNMFAYGGKNTTRDFAKERISEILKTTSPENRMDISTFIEECRKSDIHPILNLQNDGEKIAGVSFFVNSPYGRQTFKGSQLGSSWNDLDKSLVHFPEDKNYLSVSNRISLENSMIDETNLPKDSVLKKKFIDKINSSAEVKPTDNFFRAIDKFKLTPQTRKNLSTYLTQYEKGKTSITPLTYADQLLSSKASSREYSLFDWEKKNGITDKKVHVQAARFLLEKKENPKAFSWVLRYPPVSTKGISFKSHLESFDFYDHQKDFGKLKQDQIKLKEDFCNQFGIDGTSKRRFLNTPLPKEYVENLKSIQAQKNPNSQKEAFAFVHRSTDTYSTFLREKIGEICVHSGASPVASQAIYNKFLFTMEKNNLDHTLLSKFYGFALNNKPNELATKNIDALIDFKPQKTNFAERGGGFLEQFFSKLGDLPNEPSYEPRDEVETLRRKRRRRIPNS